MSYLRVLCEEPEGSVIRVVREMPFTRDNMKKLWEASSQFPVLFGRPLTSLEDLISFLLIQNLSGDPEPTGLWWVVDDFVGTFFMDDITPNEATVHYSFFDKRHKGREILVREMMKKVFDEFGFNRLNASVPAYVGQGPRLFIEKCGFKIEGVKRKAVHWRGDLFNVYNYGILRGEL